MSHDIYLLDPKTRESIELSERHSLTGGTYALGGTNEAWLNVTYNYAKHLWRVLGDGGVKVIYGLSGSESVPVLQAAIKQLGDDIDEDYWKPTEGNARQALVNLLALAELCPDGVWDGD